MLALLLLIFFIVVAIMIVSRLGRRNRLAEAQHRQLVGLLAGDPLAGYRDDELISFNGKIGKAGAFRAARAELARRR